MLKKRYNTATVIVIMLIAIACVVGALFLIKNRFGISRKEVIPTMCFVLFSATYITLSLTRGRSGEIVEQPGEYPPEGIDPLTAGCIIDGHVGSRDITAAFFYLAVNGFMYITEYERKHFEFRAEKYPEKEPQALQMLYRAIFGTEICDLVLNASGVEMDNDALTVKLEDVSKRLIAAIPAIEQNVIKKIRKKKNREIADMTGKVIGFRNYVASISKTVAIELFENDPHYVYKVLPYAYLFAITSKLSANFTHVDIDPPEWYRPYGVTEGYHFDVVIYNSIIRNLPEELRILVFDQISILDKINL